MVNLGSTDDSWYTGFRVITDRDVLDLQCINKQDNVACLMDCEIEVKVKYGWLHSRSHAKMYAWAKYHWL